MIQDSFELSGEVLYGHDSLSIPDNEPGTDSLLFTFISVQFKHLSII